MSWSLNFAARDRAHARAIVANYRESAAKFPSGYAPPAVFDMVEATVDAMTADGPVLVEGHGHQFHGQHNDFQTQCELKVRPLRFFDAL